MSWDAWQAFEMRGHVLCRECQNEWKISTKIDMNMNNLCKTQCKLLNNSSVQPLVLAPLPWWVVVFFLVVQKRCIWFNRSTQNIIQRLYIIGAPRSPARVESSDKWCDKWFQRFPFCLPLVVDMIMDYPIWLDYIICFTWVAQPPTSFYSKRVTVVILL